MVLQSDDKLILGGYARNGSYTDFSLARYDADGDIDTGFGTSGKVVSYLPGTGHQSCAVAISPLDGRIVVGGRYTPPSATYQRVFIVRFNDRQGKALTSLNAPSPASPSPS